ncbi:hypothetical protein D3C76_1730380 [compost metagenome]
MERYFMFIKPNGDVSGLFKSNDEDMIADQLQRMRLALVSMAEISREEHAQLEREMEQW